MNKLTPLALLALVATLNAANLAAAEDLDLSNKWRIECSRSAKSDGSVVFRVTPKQGTPIDVTVAIRKGRGENGVADDIRDAFRNTLDREQFHSETDDGEDVLLKKRRGAPDFELKLVASSVQNVSFDIEKE